MPCMQQNNNIRVKDVKYLKRLKTLVTLNRTSPIFDSLLHYLQNFKNCPIGPTTDFFFLKANYFHPKEMWMKLSLHCYPFPYFYSSVNNSVYILNGFRKVLYGEKSQSLYTNELQWDFSYWNKATLHYSFTSIGWIFNYCSILSALFELDFHMQMQI